MKKNNYCYNGISENLVKSYQKNGFAIVKNFFKKNEILKYPQKFKLTPLKYKITGKSKKFIKANKKISNLNNSYGNWNLMLDIEKGELKEIFDSGKHKSQITYRCLTY